MPQICIVPRVDGIGGVASFRLKMEAGLTARGFRVVNDSDDPQNDAVLVVAGTRRIDALIRARRRGVSIIQRLDGINWIYRRRFISLRHTLRSIYGNQLLSFTRRVFADKVIYQSHFVQGWWEDWYGALNKPAHIIYNGVDLNKYAPAQTDTRPQDKVRILVVEGSLSEGQSVGLSWAVDLAERLHSQRPTELMIAAKVSAVQQEDWQRRARVPLNFLGTVPREKIPELHAAAHFYFSAELNPPCPNAVIEALACGSPVVGFDSGALKELVTPEAGMIVPFGADPWKVEHPDVAALANKIPALLAELPRYQAGARRRAEEAFSLDTMVEKYLNVLLG
jgi:glycosyltransferase involved in cell wall biosynthesis